MLCYYNLSFWVLLIKFPNILTLNYQNIPSCLCIVYKAKKNVFLVKLFLQNWCGHAFFVFFTISEIPDGEKRSEMVVNLILRYEKNGIWIEYIISLYYSTLWRRWYRVYSLDGIDGSQGASENKLKKKMLMRTGRDWRARWPEAHVVVF
jgi:hypothetical protein